MTSFTGSLCMAGPAAINTSVYLIKIFTGLSYRILTGFVFSQVLPVPGIRDPGAVFNMYFMVAIGLRCI